jgi:hypothetical protein
MENKRLQAGFPPPENPWLVANTLVGSQLGLVSRTNSIIANRLLCVKGVVKVKSQTAFL